MPQGDEEVITYSIKFLIKESMDKKIFVKRYKALSGFFGTLESIINGHILEIMGIQMTMIKTSSDN